MIMIETKCQNMAIFIVEYLHLTKLVPNIPLGYNSYARKIESNWLFFDLLNNIKQQDSLKKSLPYFQSKEKESSPLSIGVESSGVTTEVDNSMKVDWKPTKDELNNMVNVENRSF